jgi:hypothetical protein
VKDSRPRNSASRLREPCDVESPIRQTGSEGLEVVVAFWRERRPGVPFTLLGEVITLAERLAREEFEGPEQQLKTGLKVRSWPIPPYRLFYRRRDGVLEVMRIYHQARRPITR